MLSSSAIVQFDETERLKTLLQYEILDSLPDPAFDEIAHLAALTAKAQYAYIGFVDWSRIWFKSTVGFNAREIRRHGSACQFLLLEGKPLLIADAFADPRFDASGIRLDDLVKCRSYAGAPVISRFRRDPRRRLPSALRRQTLSAAWMSKTCRSSPAR